MTATVEMPKYVSHKKVWALKIKDIQVLDDAARFVLTPEESGYAPFEVSPEYMEKHKPTVGGYFVQYADGYKSFSPAQPFEEGYTLVA